MVIFWRWLQGLTRASSEHMNIRCLYLGLYTQNVRYEQPNFIAGARTFVSNKWHSGQIAPNTAKHATKADCSEESRWTGKHCHSCRWQRDSNGYYNCWRSYNIVSGILLRCGLGISEDLFATPGLFPTGCLAAAIWRTQNKWFFTISENNWSELVTGCSKFTVNMWFYRPGKSDVDRGHTKAIVLLSIEKSICENYK